MNPRALLALVLVLLAAVPVASGATRTVKLQSESFAPRTITIHKGDKIRFRWVTGFHNVRRVSGPAFKRISSRDRGTVARAFTTDGPVPAGLLDPPRPRDVPDGARQGLTGRPRSVGYPPRAVPEFPLALTYDDVLLVPRRSSIGSRAQVDTTARFTRGLAVAAPVIAANMETVTEARMAIAMARAGGLGVIHRFLPLAQQVAEVERVKRAENLVIAQPYAIAGDGHGRPRRSR